MYFFRTHLKEHGSSNNDATIPHIKTVTVTIRAVPNRSKHQSQHWHSKSTIKCWLNSLPLKNELSWATARSHWGRARQLVRHFSKRKCLIWEEKLIVSVCLVSLPAEKEQEPKLTCEYCGWVDFAYTFKGSKRFCSMVCAKRQVTSSFILLLICL